MLVTKEAKVRRSLLFEREVWEIEDRKGYTGH